MKYTPRQYAESLIDLLREKGEKDRVITSFVSTVRKNGDAAKLPEIMRNIETVWYERHGKIKIEATVARGTPHLPKKIGGKEVELHVHQDPAVLGGMRLQIGDYLIDATLKERLNALSKAIAQ